MFNPANFKKSDPVIMHGSYSNKGNKITFHHISVIILFDENL